MVGLQKQGKTLFFRDFLHHLRHSTDDFIIAPGIKGLVMTVFTLPSYPYVFKVIRDKIALSKETTREKVKEKYVLVKHHDRVGRMADTLEYSDVPFPRERLTPELVAELKSVAPSLIEDDGDMIVVKHLYIERRMMPLNLFLESAKPAQRARAIRDYGDAVKQLAAVNIFAGDLLFKNFGVTRFGRVVFYDYDEIDYLTACSFRKIPPPPAGYDEMSDEIWYPVAANDVFPEEFATFLLTDPEVRADFLQAHADLLDSALVAGGAAVPGHRRAARSTFVSGFGAIRAGRPSARPRPSKRAPPPRFQGRGADPTGRATAMEPPRQGGAPRPSPAPPRRRRPAAQRRRTSSSALRRVLRDSVTMLVEAADDVLRSRVAVLGRRLVPSRRELPVLRCASAEEILRRQLDLGVDVPLLRRLLPPFTRRRQRARDANPALVEQAKVVLRLAHASIGCLPQPSRAAFWVRHTALPAQQHHREVVLGKAVAYKRLFLVEASCRRVVATHVSLPCRPVRARRRG